MYGSDDSILFISDQPRDATVLHTYLQRDEYESAATNTGLWKLSADRTTVTILDHAPSGDFNPIIDSFGRVVFSRWDNLQRDQQNIGVNHGAINFVGETSSQSTGSAPEVSPEPRSVNDPAYRSNINLFTLNQFFPWTINQDGSDLETLNHVGRQEIGVYAERSFNDDPNVQEFYGQYSTGTNPHEFTIALHLKEDPATPGRYLATSYQEFGTHAAGQIIAINGAPGVNPNNVTVEYLTHPETSRATNTPSGNHTGLLRDPLKLTNGSLLAVHTSETRQDANIGSTTAPLSRYGFRIRRLDKTGTYFIPGSFLTGGISKSVSYWSPDQMRSYAGVLWEMSPVELVARTPPIAGTLQIPPIEQSVIDAMGVTTQELVSYLQAANLALVVTRNVTSRDKNDRQQPTNLRVPGTSTQSIPRSGKVYDVSRLDFFQGDLIRGYTNGNSQGRRVLAQPMHSVAHGINLAESSLPAGLVKIASDGSMAAFVPAGRALTWQLSALDGTPVVRERYWGTFKKGEVRVCASCHGVNTVDHLGNPPPSNPPLALAQLLAHWKNLPPPEQLPPGLAPAPGSFSLSIRPRGVVRSQGQLTIRASAAHATEALELTFKIDTTTCATRKGLPPGSLTRVLAGRLPAEVAGRRMTVMLHRRRQRAVLARSDVEVLGKRSPRVSNYRVCRVLLGALR